MGQSGPGSNGNEEEHCIPQRWRLIIRLFSVISRTLVVGILTPLQRFGWCILQPKPTGPSIFFLYRLIKVDQVIFASVSNCWKICTCIYIHTRRHTWCNGYYGREVSMVIRDQILDEAFGISHSANNLWKGVNPSILPIQLWASQ